MPGLLVGVCYLVTPWILLPPYIVLNYLFLYDLELSKLYSYRILIHMGICDCLQLLCHSTAGIFAIFPEVQENNHRVVEVLGAILNTAWVGLFPFSLCIALQRLLVVLGVVDSKTRPKFFICLIIIGWTYTLVFFIICITPMAGIDFYGWAWGYDTEKSWSGTMERVEFMVSVPSIGIIFLIYVAVGASVAWQRRSHHLLARRFELPIILQAFILFVNLTLLITSWHHYAEFLPDTQWTVFAVNMYWILYGGLNPALALIINETVRRRFLRFFGIGLQQSSTVTVSVSKRTNKPNEIAMT